MAALSLHSLNCLCLMDFNRLEHRCSSSCELKANKCGFSLTDSNRKSTEKALEQEEQDIGSDSFHYGRLLQRSAKTKYIEVGKRVHACLMKAGLERDMFMENTLVNMYAKCGLLKDARQVFDNMSERNIVSWTTMIAGYAQQRQNQEAIELYQEMLGEGLRANQFTFASVLRACANSASVKHGKQIHAQVMKTGLGSDVTIGNALVTMYARCGSLENAREVFDGISERDVVSWSAIIAGYVQNGHGVEAQKLFLRMLSAGVKSDKFIFATALVACGDSENLELGKQVHAHVIKTEFESDALMESTLVTMYVKCGSLEDADKVFDKVLESDLVTWTAMIAGYAQSGRGESALKVFCKMLQAGIMPDNFSFTSVLGVCADLAIIDQGKQFHGQIIKGGFQQDASVGSALITMYAKCSCIGDACEVFEMMPKPDVVSWTAMITGYALHGQGKEALQLFEQMQCAGIKPDRITFVGVLSACSHVGLVDEGRQYFDAMTRDYDLVPTMEHYACIVDQLGRAGRLDEAEGFINEMPFKPSALVWGTLLSACKIHGNMKLGKHVAEKLLELEPQESAPYVLLSNIYASESRWEDVARVRKLMKDRGIVKAPGQSWIVVQNKAYAFYADDRLHPQTEEIYATLEELIAQIEAAGYVPRTNIELHKLGPEQKKNIFSHHSEKLAIAYGLIKTAPGTPIRVLKNLRVCVDCHNVAKFIGLVVEREIVLRDNNRFHHFKNGSCSCGNYW